MKSNVDVTNHIKVIKAVIEYKTNNDGNSPTIREIMTSTGIVSTSETSSILNDCVKLGLFTYEGNRSRALRVMGGRWVAPFWYDGIDTGSFEQHIISSMKE